MTTTVDDYPLPTDLDAMRRLRLRLDIAIAHAYAAMPATNGSGGASLPTFPNLVGAALYAAECSRGGEQWEPCEVGERYSVRRVMGKDGAA